MSLRDDMKKDAEQYGAMQGGGMFQFDHSGSFKLRLLTKGEAIATHFFGQGQPSHVCYGMHKGCPFHGDGAPKDKDGKDKAPSVKFVAYVLDRTDGKVKLGELPWSVMQRIADFEEDEDFKFDSYPMPYDIKVKVDKENKDPKAIYKTDPSPVRSEISEEERNELIKASGKITPGQFVEKRKEKELAKQMESGVWQEAADKRKASLANASTGGAAQGTDIDYPTGEVNPDDIPF